MSEDHHTPISVGAAGEVATVNSPLAELDEEIGDYLHKKIVWSQATWSTADNTDATALPEPTIHGPEAIMMMARVSYTKEALHDRLAFRGQGQRTSGTGLSLYIEIPEASLVSGSHYITTDSPSWEDFDESDCALNISSLTDGETYEVHLWWSSDFGTGGDGKLRRLSMVAYRA